MADTTDLYFDLEAVLRLAEHAAAAPEHAQSYSEADSKTPCPGALMLVKDEGVYLMSNGLPGPALDGSHVVFAHGWTPDSPDDPSETHLGDDDFAEHLHLTDPYVGSATLLDALRDTHARGYRYLLLKVRYDRYTVTITQRRPPGA